MAIAGLTLGYFALLAPFALVYLLTLLGLQ